MVKVQRWKFALTSMEHLIEMLSSPSSPQTALQLVIIKFLCTYHLSLCSSSELSIMTITGGADYEEVLAALTTVELTFGRTKRQTDTPGPLTETECIPLSFLSDDLVEDDETFTVHLVSDDPLVMLYPAWADVVIINNDREFQM